MGRPGGPAPARCPLGGRTGRRLAIKAAKVSSSARPVARRNEASHRAVMLVRVFITGHRVTGGYGTTIDACY